MKYLMNDINIYIINDTIYFCVEKKSILHNSKVIPPYNKKQVNLFEYVKQDDYNIYLQNFLRHV